MWAVCVLWGVYYRETYSCLRHCSWSKLQFTMSQECSECSVLTPTKAQSTNDRVEKIQVIPLSTLIKLLPRLNEDSAEDREGRRGRSSVMRGGNVGECHSKCDQGSRYKDSRRSRVVVLSHR